MATTPFNEAAIKGFEQRANIVVSMRKFNLTREQWYAHWVEYEMRRHKKAMEEITQSLMNR